MTLKPQDVLVLLKLVASGAQVRSSYHALARELGMSSSEVHKALKRCVDAHLAVKSEQGVRPLRPALLEFITHGIRYVFPAERGGLTRGMPTASAAPPASVGARRGPATRRADDVRQACLRCAAGA